MLLLDKGYYDYDYEKTAAPTPVVDWEDTIKSEEEVNDILSMFGLGQRATEEENLQEFIIKEEEQKNGSRDSGSY